jgi:hypothetical protein
MELSSYLAREKWSDEPECVSPVITVFLRGWHDALSDEVRQHLKPYAWRVLGTATTVEDEATRTWMTVDWLVRVQAPAWLRLAGRTDAARALESLPRIVDVKTATAAREAIPAAGDGASDGAWAAASDAVWAAAGVAVRAAAGDAARDAVWAAAGVAVRAAAGDAARDAVWAATQDTAKAAWAAARAAWAAWAAARAASKDAAKAEAGALAPTVLALQDSAFGLLDEMIAVGHIEVEPLVPPATEGR